ncbi:ankyrin repeat [Anaeramoeba flamelloides]|uniref:Ankyrin repeat n=1 Tax=Anaeramoeba flamelloides TaxID=1746091 RepID=A0ABQ8ZD13_9EUKA|nr:ankyrin repeat [Anaeramoeba flamelloides]
MDFLFFDPSFYPSKQKTYHHLKKKLTKEDLKCVKSGSIENIKKVIKEKSLASTDDKGNTILHLLIYLNCDYETIHQALDQNQKAYPIISDLDQVNDRGWTALHFLSFSKNKKVKKYYKLLISYGATVNFQNPQTKVTVFHLVCEMCPKVDLIEFLIESGAKYDIENNKNMTPFSIICDHEPKPKVLSLMLNKFFSELKIQQEEKENENENKNEIEIEKQKEEEKEHKIYIIKNELPINDKKLMQTKKSQLNSGFHLYSTTENLNIDCLKLFFSFGASLDFEDEWETTVFHSICQNKNVTVNILELCQKHGANWNHKKLFGCTPFTEFCLAKKIQYPILEFALKNGANPNITSSNKQTALHRICGNYVDIKILELFKQNGADFNLQDFYSLTPFHVYCLSDNIKSNVVKYFLLNTKFTFSKNGCPLFKDPLDLICFDSKPEIKVIKLIIDFMNQTITNNVKNANNSSNNKNNNNNSSSSSSNIQDEDKNEKENGNQEENHNQNIQNPKFLWDPLLSILNKNQNPDIEIIKMLIDNGYSINSKDGKLNSPLHYLTGFTQLRVKLPLSLNMASKVLLYGNNEKNFSSFQIIKFFIDNNADVNSKNTKSQTPLLLISKTLLKFLKKN